MHFTLLADPGKARGCSINSLLINSFSEWVSQPFPTTALWRRHAQTVRVSTSRFKIDYVIMIKNFLNPEGHQNPFCGSKVMAILLKGWIWPIGGVSAGKGLSCSLRSRLVLLRNWSLVVFGGLIKMLGLSCKPFGGLFRVQGWMGVEKSILDPRIP